jgi:hypothetical protein
LNENGINDLKDLIEESQELYESFVVIKDGKKKFLPLQRYGNDCQSIEVHSVKDAADLAMEYL